MFERSNVLRDEFNKQTEKFADRQANYKTMEQLAKQGEGASDIALIFSLMKVYDPDIDRHFRRSSQCAELSRCSRSDPFTMEHGYWWRQTL